MPVFSPPLLGDEDGNYRIQVVGNSGSGKSTLSAYLSTKLNVPHISLDKVSWQPGWQQLPANEFKEKVRALMAQHTQGWIIDGDYGRLLGPQLVPDNATDIIWLDPPLYYYFPRLLWRTLLRLLGLRAQCAEGCEESWKEVFSTKGIVWWCITHHPVARVKYSTWLIQRSIGVGGNMRRLDESKGELAKWKDDLEDYCRQR